MLEHIRLDLGQAGGVGPGNGSCGHVAECESNSRMGM
jgi:hypothetical protein